MTQNRIKRQNFKYILTPLIKDGSHLPQSYMLLQYVLNFNLKVVSTTLIDVKS